MRFSLVRGLHAPSPKTPGHLRARCNAHPPPTADRTPPPRAGDLDTRNKWRDYVRRTPRLFGQLASPSDPTYLAVEERQDQENRGDEIAGIMAITGGAGVATAVVGFIGWLLIS